MVTTDAIIRVRVIVSGIVLAAAIPWLLSAAVPPRARDVCEYGHIWPCDPNDGYIWDGDCYLDDGCYYTLEDCCI